MHASAGRDLDPKGEYRASKSILGSYFDSLSNCVINITPYVINWNSTAIKSQLTDVIYLLFQGFVYISYYMK